MCNFMKTWQKIASILQFKKLLVSITQNYKNKRLYNKFQNIKKASNEKQPETKSSHTVSCLSLCTNLPCSSIYLRANRQTEQRRAPLTAGVASQRSPVAKLPNQVHENFLPTALSSHRSDCSRGACNSQTKSATNNDSSIWRLDVRLLR